MVLSILVAVNRLRLSLEFEMTQDSQLGFQSAYKKMAINEVSQFLDHHSDLTLPLKMALTYGTLDENFRH